MDRNERRKYIQELFKYVDGNSILVIKDWNTLERIYCPFMVKAIRDVGSLKAGNIYCVYTIQIANKTMKDVFIIENNAYYFLNFKII